LFKQEAWLKQYIETNTIKRAKAKGNKFLEDFYKLMNNACFGKTMEDVRKHMDYRISMKPAHARRHFARPSYKRHTIIRPDDENGKGAILGIEQTKTSVTLNKPIFAGLAILDLSKLLMYNYHYNVIKAKYGNKARLLMTDTDSLIYEIETEDIFKDMLENLQTYDTSAYPENHMSGLNFKYSDPAGNNGEKVPGRFKDEMEGFLLLEFVGLRAKMYSKMKYQFNSTGTQKAKGISSAVVRKQLNHQKYLDCLVDGKGEQLDIFRFHTKNHVVSSVTQPKAGLCSFDDKRWLMEDGIHTLAYGHYSTL